ncbi:MAG TPA: F0F1 ATP synthase subunit B [Candidatus Cloacimonadota bacterium]|nr:F0F1 ATP synthase subunit B [Candidatus Cloacimonadota bacterium]
MISINYVTVIVILNFILLLIILNRLLYKPFKQFLTKRQKAISDDLDQAKASKEEAEKLALQKQDELKSSAEEIRVMKKAAQKDAEAKATNILNSAKTLEKKILQDAESQLEHEKKEAMHEVESDITTLVANLSAKFLTSKLDEKNDTELIKKILSESEDK